MHVSVSTEVARFPIHLLSLGRWKFSPGDMCMYWSEVRPIHADVSPPPITACMKPGKIHVSKYCKIGLQTYFFDFKPISCKSLSLSLSVYCCQCPSVKNKGAFARMPALSKILMTISFPWSWCWMLIWKHWLEVLKYFELISWIHPNSVSIWTKMMDWNIFVYSLGFDAGGVWVKFVRYNSLVCWAPWMFGKQLGGSQNVSKTTGHESQTLIFWGNQNLRTFDT